MRTIATLALLLNTSIAVAQEDDGPDCSLIEDSTDRGFCSCMLIDSALERLDCYDVAAERAALLDRLIRLQAQGLVEKLMGTEQGIQAMRDAVANLD